MEILQYVHFVWIPALALVLLLKLRAAALTSQLIKKYRIPFQLSIFGTVSISELTIASNESVSEEIQQKIANLIAAKRLLLVFAAIAILFFLLPTIVTKWLL